MKTITKVLCMVFALLIFALMAMGSGSDSGSKSDSGVSVETNAGSTEGAESAQTEAQDQAPETEAPQQNNTIHVGETLNANGLKISYEKVEEYVSDNEFIQPESGNIFLGFYFVITNETGSDKSVGSFDFSCYADGMTCKDAYLTGDDDVLTTITTLSDGRSTKGFVYFEVPADASKIEVEYETSWWTDEKAIFVYEMN